MTPQRERKHWQRAIRNIPLDAIVPFIADLEAGSGLWCMVGGELCFVSGICANTEITLDDELVVAQVIRWVAAQPERNHRTHEAALAFVRSQLAQRNQVGNSV
jgi:hypothetical protein